jgi:hypothetical protein
MRSARPEKKIPCLTEASCLRFRQINPILAKFRRSFGQAALALGTFFGCGGGIDHLLDCLRGEFGGTGSAASLADRL